MIITKIQESCGQYWETVKHAVAGYFEFNTGKEIIYQKHYEGTWRGCRWRPKELSL